MTLRFPVLGLTVVLLALAGCTPLLPSVKTGNQSIKACTQEAMLCPDGSTVGRSGPNCEFAPCPSAPTSGANTPVACGMIDGKKVDCAEGQMCANFAGFSSLPQTRCLEANFCAKYQPCAANEECVMQESWPVQIRCVPKDEVQDDDMISAEVPKDARVEGGMTICSQDEKLCPNGSMVGRVGPDCEFAPCT